MEKLSRYSEKRSFLTLSILGLLQEHGELTRKEICDYIKRDRLEISAVISRLGKKTKTLPKRVFIIRYVREDFWLQRWVPVYALGNSRNTPKPPPQSRKDISQRHYRSKKQKVNSVFMLGMTRRERKDHADATRNSVNSSSPEHAL